MRTRASLLARLSRLLLGLAIFGTGVGLATGARAIPILSFDVTTPASGPLDPGDPFVVDVRISNLASDESVAAYDLTVTFSPAQLVLDTAEGTDGVVFGTELGTPLSQTVDSGTSGEVQVIEISLEGSSFFDTQPSAFTLFTIHFDADQEGSTTLDFLDDPPSNPLDVSDPDGNLLAVDTVPLAVTVPEPGAGWLLGGAALALLGAPRPARRPGA